MMGEFIPKITVIIPVRWATDGVDAVMYRGAGLSGAILPSVILVGFALVFTSVAVVGLRKV